MEYYTRDSLRRLREGAPRQTVKTSGKGSRLISILIIAIFLISAFFFIKTAKPQWFSAIGDFKIGTTTLKGIGTGIFDKIKGNTVFQTVFNPSAEQDNLQSNEADKNSDTSPVNQSGDSGDALIDIDKSLFTYVGGSSDGAGISFLLIDKVNFLYKNPLDTGVITSPYGERSDPFTDKPGFHTGIDIAADKGSDILSFGDGKVREIGYDEVYGNYVLVDHDDNISTFYAHLSKITVKAGQSIKCGNKLGVIGSTGRSTGTHLHFELRINDVAFDPAPYLSDYPLC